MKGFKLNDNGDVEISNIDKLIIETVKGETLQDGVPSVANPIPLVGTINNSFQSGKGTILHGVKGTNGAIEYQDTIVLDRKKRVCTLTQNCGYVELTGSEFWRFKASSSENFYYANVAITATGISDVKADTTFSSFLCSHLPYKYSSRSYKHWSYEGITGTPASAGEAFGMAFNVESIGGATTLDEFKAWVKAQYDNGTPLTVVYPLSEPKITTLTYKDTKYNCEIQMVNGNELLRQKVQCVLGTNKGEWFLNEDEGIEFSNLLGKIQDEELIRNEILQGLLQVDSSFSIQDFSCEFDSRKRKVIVGFTASNETGETVTGVQTWD